MAQLVRGPGSVSGHELVVGADWLSVGDPASEGETVEFWAHPRRGVQARDRRITLGWGASSLRFRRALAPEKWSYVAVSWDGVRVRLDLDGQTIESYGLGEPSGVAEPHRLSVGRDALTSAPRWVALYSSSIDVRSVVRHYRAALPLMRPVADPRVTRDGRVIAHAAAVPANTVLPAITGTAKDGQTLTSTTGTWTGSPTSYARQWLRCDTAGTNCTNISGATATTYVLTATDVGMTIRVKVTATNGSGSANVNSAQTATVVAAAPVVSAVPTISGTAKDGQTLTSTTGTWSGTATITYARQWNRCNSGGTGCVAISGATGTTYVVTTADIGSKLNVTVTASNAVGSASSSSVVSALITGNAPANTALPAISGTAKEGQMLSATTGAWTGTATITYAYQWQSCTPTCTNISGATAATWRLVAAQVGKTIKVVVTATNGAGSASATSAATATVTTGAPVNAALPVLTGTTTQGQSLSSSTGTWAGTATITYARQWKRCNAVGGSCTNISGATGTTYTLVSADVGSTIKLTVMATNGVGNAAADAATTAVVAPLPPANTALPTITGSAQDGQTLTSTTGTWNGTTPLTYGRQWRRCDATGAACNDIAGAGGTAYAATSADIGATIRVVVTATNGAGSAAATSAATSVVTAGAPVVTTAPAIAGTPRDGQTLTASAGTWAGTAPISYTYAWLTCNSSGASCTALSGVTASTLTLAAAQVGKTIKVTVTATNGAGSSSATSAATSVVLGGPPTNTSLPTINGLNLEGYTYTGTTGGWSSAAGTITYTRQWKRCDTSGANCTAIAGATASSYVLVSADVGMTIRESVIATNTGGSTTASSNPSPVIQGIAPSNTTPPSISGQAIVGTLLTADPGTWSGTTPMTITYVWSRCVADGGSCTAIDGATDATYTLANDDIGFALTVTVKATNQVWDASKTTARTTLVRKRVTGQVAMDDAVAALYRGSWYEGPECSATCEAIHQGELNAGDSETEDQLTRLRLALGLLGPTGVQGAAARSATTRSTRPAASAARAQQRRAGVFGPLEASRLAPPAAAVRSAVKAKAASVEDPPPLDLSNLYKAINGISLHYDRDIAYIQVRTSSGARYFWPWRVPLQGLNVPADMGAYPPYSASVNIGLLQWIPGPVMSYDNVPYPASAWYGRWTAMGNNYFESSTWLEDPIPPFCPRPRTFYTRPLETPAGFSRTLSSEEWEQEGDYGEVHHCRITNGFLTGFATPAGPMRPWTAADPATPDGVLDVTQLGDPAPAPPPPLGGVYDDLCEHLSSGDFPQADELLAHPCDRGLAEMFRPKLLFDTSEHWRPLDVDGFFGERNGTTPMHTVCDSPTQCTGLSDASDLDGHDSSSYIDVEGALGGNLGPFTYKDPEYYLTPTFACWTDVLQDCDSGSASANYYTVSPPSTVGGYRYIDYWNYYRVNYFGGAEIANEYNHQSDWEAVSVAPSRTRWQSFDFASFSQHDGPFKSYLRENLRCDDPGSPDTSTCGTDAEPTGTRVLSYVANGSHANYPRRCSEHIAYVSCQQEGTDAFAGGFPLPERGHDGAQPWGNNDDMTSLKEMPAPGDGRPYDWSRFPGHWGVPDAPDWSEGPISPMLQPHATNPLHNSCARDQDLCALASAVGARPRSSASRQEQYLKQLGSCSTWFGADVQAALCAPSSLGTALRRAGLGRPGQVRLLPSRAVAGAARSVRAARARSTAQTAPGLAQRVGAPMRPGAQLVLQGRVPAEASLLVRVADGKRVWKLNFAVPAHARNATLAVGRQGGARLMLRSGRILRPMTRSVVRP